MSLLNVGTESRDVHEVQGNDVLVDTIYNLNVGMEREEIAELVDEVKDDEDDIIYSLVDGREEIDTAQSEISRLTEVADDLSNSIEKDSVAVAMADATRVDDSIDEYKEATFRSDIESSDEGIIGIENATTPLEKLAVGLEAKESLLRKINRKIREFIKMIIRNIRKLIVKVFVFVSGFFVDIAKHRDGIEEMEEDTVVLTGTDLDTKLNKRIRKILGYYLTDIAQDIQVGNGKRGNSTVLKAAYNCLDAIEHFYNDKRITDIKDRYEEVTKFADGEQERKFTINNSYIVNYLATAKEDVIPTSSKIRKMLGDTDKLIYATGMTTPKGIKLYTLAKGKNENKKKWEVNYGESKHGYNGALEDIAVSELKEFANEAVLTMDNFDINQVTKAMFGVIKDIDDDLARLESSGKGNKTKLRKVQQLVKFISNTSIEYIYTTHSNVKALNSLLKTLKEEN